MKRIAVIIGRFQVASLTEGHRSLIDRALADNDELIILVGTSQAALSTHDPLTFDVREHMLKDAYPNACVLEIPDAPVDVVWSESIDALLAIQTLPDARIRLYGSRDSFIPRYTGVHETVCLDPLSLDSGTDARNGITPEPAEAFRKGMIHAANTRYPTSYQAVDIAVINNDLRAVLLGQKETDGDKWRFVGGFVDPSDESLENAAFRELREEAGDLGTSAFHYIGSLRINDWRYRESTDKLMTALFVTDFHYGKPVASDDIARIAWIPITDLHNVLVESHAVLGEKLIAHLANRAYGAKE